MSIKESELAKRLAPYIARQIAASTATGGGGSGQFSLAGVLTNPMHNNLDMNNWSILNVNTVDGVDISTILNLANATIVAGDGLSGGGVLGAGPVTLHVDRATNSGLTFSSTKLAVGAGDGIAVTGALTKVNLATDSGLTFSGAKLTLGAPGSISTTSTSHVTGTTHNHPVTATADGAANHNTLLKSGTGGDLKLDELTVQLLNADNILTIQPIGDVVMDPGGQDVLPGGSIRVDLGDYNRMWRTLFAAELYVQTLVAQEVISTIGGRIIVTPTTQLTRDLAAGATQFYVKHNSIQNGDFMMMQTAPGGIAQFEVVKVTSTYTTITAGEEYRYTITRDEDGTGLPGIGNNWYAGDAVASLRNAVGEGWIELTSTETVYNDLGPNITIYERTGTTAWDQRAPVSSWGNLESFMDYSTEQVGIAAGNDLYLDPTLGGFKGFAIDRQNGMRMFNTDIHIYRSGTEVFRVNSAGPYLALGNPLPTTYGQSGIWFGHHSGSYKAYVGNATNYWKFDGTDMTLSGRFFIPGVGEIVTIPGEWRGAWASGTTYGLNDMVSYGGQTYIATQGHTSTPDGDLGPPGVGLYWDLMVQAGADNQDFAFLEEAEADVPAGYTGLMVTGDKMGYVDDGDFRTYQDSSGNFFFGGNSGNYLFWNESQGRLGGANATTGTQWYAASSDGKLRAGAGAVVLSTKGIDLDAFTNLVTVSLPSLITWWADADNPGTSVLDAAGFIGAYESGATRDLYVRSYAPTGGLSHARLYADVATGNGYSRFYVRGNAGTNSGYASLTTTQIDFVGSGAGSLLFNIDHKLAIASHLERQSSTGTQNIGDPAKPFSNLYVENLFVTGSNNSGPSLSGHEWEHAGDMFIDANGAGVTRTLFIVNQASGGSANLNVEGHIIVGGNVDGVDVFNHATDIDAHHRAFVGITDGSTAAVPAEGSNHITLQGTGGIGILAGVNTVTVSVSASTILQQSTITAGNGLTGGGQLHNNPTIHIGAGDGLTLGTDSITVDTTVARRNAPNTFTAQQNFSSSALLNFLSTNSHLAEFGGSAYAVGRQANTLYLRTDHRFSVYLDGEHSATDADPGSGGSILLAVTSAAFQYLGNTVWHGGNVAAGYGIEITGTTIAVDTDVVGNVHSSRTLNAGAGLTGGGDLSQDRTFNVGQGDGLTVSADAVAVDATVARRNADNTFAGNVAITGTLTVDDVTTLGVLNAGASNLATATVAGNVNVGGMLGVTGAVSLSSSLNVDGTSNFEGTADFNSPVTVVTSLTVTTGQPTALGGTLTVTGTAGFDGTATFNAALVANGTATFENTLTANGAAIFNNTLTANGALVANNTATFNSGVTIAGGVLAARSDTDTLHVIARAAIGHGSNVDWATFGHIDNQGSDSGYALGASPLGDTHLYARAARSIYFGLAGTNLITMDASGTLRPINNMEPDLGAYNTKWRTLYAGELVVDTLVAQDVMATIGGRILVAPTSKLTRDLGPSDTTVYLAHDSFASGDYLYMSTIVGTLPQWEAYKVTSAPTTILEGEEYSYTISRGAMGVAAWSDASVSYSVGNVVTRNSNFYRAIVAHTSNGSNGPPGTNWRFAGAVPTARAWYEGDAAVSLGSAAGEGWIDLTSTTTTLNHLGPTMAIYRRTGAEGWASSAATVAVGNLRSWVDYSVDEFGIALGNDLLLQPATGFKGLTADATNGVRLFNTPLAIYNGATKVVDLSLTPVFKIGPDVNNLTYDIGTGVWMGLDLGSYKFRVGTATSFLRFNGTDVSLTGRLYAGPGQEVSIDQNGIGIETGDNAYNRVTWYGESGQLLFFLGAGNSADQISARDGKSLWIDVVDASFVQQHWWILGANGTASLSGGLMTLSYSLVQALTNFQVDGRMGLGTSGSDSHLLNMEPNSTSQNGILVNMPAGSVADALQLLNNGTETLAVSAGGVVEITTANATPLTMTRTGATAAGAVRVTRATNIYGSGLTGALITSSDHLIIGTDDGSGNYAFSFTEAGNMGVLTTSFGGGVGVIGIKNATTVPSTNPSGGGVLYAQSGAGKWRGSSGTISTFGPAEPHCPSCGADYMQEYDNKQYGYFAICLKCLADELGERPWILRRPSQLEN